MKKSFGDRLKELRTEKQLTQEQLANTFNTGKASISHYESGKRFPDVHAIEKFAEFFQVSVDYLLGNSDVRKSDDLENVEMFKRKSKLFDKIAQDLEDRGEITDNMSPEEKYERIKEQIELINSVYKTLLRNKEK